MYNAIFATNTANIQQITGFFLLSYVHIRLSEQDMELISLWLYWKWQLSCPPIVSFYFSEWNFLFFWCISKFFGFVVSRGQSSTDLQLASHFPLFHTNINLYMPQGAERFSLQCWWYILLMDTYSPHFVSTLLCDSSFKNISHSGITSWGKWSVWRELLLSYSGNL